MSKRQIVHVLVSVQDSDVQCTVYNEKEKAQHDYVKIINLIFGKNFDKYEDAVYFNTYKDGSLLYRIHIASTEVM